MGLTRKKITVKTKRGKSFQRSVMVRAEAIGKRTGGKKLNSLNPWAARHTGQVSTDKSKLGDKAKFYGNSGPGSDHSWFAHQVGAMRAVTKMDSDPQAHLVGTSDHAGRRRDQGVWSVHIAETLRGGIAVPNNHQASQHIQNSFVRPSSYNSVDVHSPHGLAHVHRVHQDPRKHVRE